MVAESHSNTHSEHNVLQYCTSLCIALFSSNKGTRLTREFDDYFQGFTKIDNHISQHEMVSILYFKHVVERLRLTCILSRNAGFKWERKHQSCTLVQLCFCSNHLTIVFGKVKVVTRWWDGPQQSIFPDAFLSKLVIWTTCLEYPCYWAVF